MYTANLTEILEKGHMHFLDSLQINGIDVPSHKWDINVVERNAQAGATSIMLFALQKCKYSELRDAFLQIILDQLDEGEYFSVMVWIYAAYVYFGRFPPYGIIQHAVDETLLKQYCIFLRKWLQKYRRTGKIETIPCIYPEFLVSYEQSFSLRGNHEK